MSKKKIQEGNHQKFIGKKIDQSRQPTSSRPSGREPRFSNYLSTASFNSLTVSSGSYLNPNHPGNHKSKGDQSKTFQHLKINSPIATLRARRASPVFLLCIFLWGLDQCSDSWENLEVYPESLEGTDQENPEEDRDMDPLYHLLIKTCMERKSNGKREVWGAGSGDLLLYKCEDPSSNLQHSV